MRKNKKLRKLFKAAKRGHPPSGYKLGILYQLGKITGSADLNEAAYWIYGASLKGYEPAVDWIEDYKFDDNATTQGNS